MELPNKVFILMIIIDVVKFIIIDVIMIIFDVVKFNIKSYLGFRQHM